MLAGGRFTSAFSRRTCAARLSITVRMGACFNTQIAPNVPRRPRRVHGKSTCAIFAFRAHSNTLLLPQRKYGANKRTSTKLRGQLAQEVEDFATVQKNEHGFDMVRHSLPLPVCPFFALVAQRMVSYNYTNEVYSQLNRYYAKFPSAERLHVADVEDVISACNTPTLWKVFLPNPQLEVNCVAGQVRNITKKHKLLATIQTDGYIRINFGRGPGNRYPRAYVILSSNITKSDGDSCDHKNRNRYDDRGSNLRWANGVKQRNNQASRRDGYSKSNKFLKLINPDGESISLSLAKVMNSFMFSRRQVKDAIGNSNKGKRTRGFLWSWDDMLHQDERWLPVTFYNGEKLKDGYHISSLGRLKSCFHAHSRIGSLSANGYYVVSLIRESGRKVNALTHVLVCAAFHGERPSSEHTVDHKNRIKTDNSETNLRWATAEQQANNRSNNIAPLFSSTAAPSAT
jgi:hypothetical protein